jgi:hypothetical protein
MKISRGSIGWLFVSVFFGLLGLSYLSRGQDSREWLWWATISCVVLWVMFSFYRLLREGLSKPDDKSLTKDEVRTILELEDKANQKKGNGT